MIYRKTFITAFFVSLCLTSFAQVKSVSQAGNTLRLSKADLLDKIKGGWAGQTIGVTFGGPIEFRYNGTFVQDYQPIIWHEGYLKKTMNEWPDLYDDIYMDITFVDILEKIGIDAPVDSFANAFANAKYNLWHANQAGRYNILNGIKAPQSGHWLNNPHADDIDFQIEADFSGLMSPGMPNAAIQIGDRIGHIMNYGDGWYGGVYVGAMYSLAFTSNDINYIVTEALKAIPAKSLFHQCIADVIKYHKKYPTDWKQTWFELQKRWSEDIGCPEGVFAPFDIDAKINAAYIVLGLLYGDGDFTKTIQIATRAGQDADCNPSSAAGILGTVFGYNKIPAYWKMGLKDIEDIDFKYTSMSLNKLYSTSYNHALKMIERNGGKINADDVMIVKQVPKTVRFEQSFEGMFPVAKASVVNTSKTSDEITFEFTGTGFALRGAAAKLDGKSPEYTFDTELYIDGIKVESVKQPTSYTTRRYELYWKYQLPNKAHNVKILIKNPKSGYELRLWENIVYSDKPLQRTY